jgi:anti-sigma28 factor (negative regulator of flagellin synthesis)
MKIDPHNIPKASESRPAASSAAGRSRAVGSGGSSASRPAPPSTDHLALSGGATEFQRLRSRLGDLALPDQEARIARLADEVARGTYAVTGEEIADAMLRDPATASFLGLEPEP